MKDNATWLFLEPYVHLIRRENIVLLYNTVSRTVHEFSALPTVRKLADKLSDPSNGYVIPLPAGYMKKPEVMDFVGFLRLAFLGDILDASWSAGKPVNIFPEPYVKHGFIRPPTPVSAFRPELDARDYIHELTLMLNSGMQEPGKPFSTAWRQFSFPCCTTGKAYEMDPALVQTLIDDVNKYTPTLIHLSGKNILQYPYLLDVISKLGKSPFQKKYHLPVQDWDTARISYLLSQKQTTVALYISFPADPERIGRNLGSLPGKGLMKRLEFNLVVSNPAELQAAMKIVNALALPNAFFKPMLTGGNIDFFRDQVFVSREEILASRPDQQQILSRISVNDYDFGKFTVLPRGEVFANVNDPQVGDANQHNLMQLVIRELDNGISWKRSRKDVPPCRNCRYQFLCPPVSSYEIFLRRFNFCHIYPTGEEV